MLHFQNCNNDVMLYHRINGNFLISLGADKNNEHANNSSSDDEHVKQNDPGLLMCETASGHRRLSFGENPDLHSSNVPSSTRSTSTQTVKNVGMQ